MIKTHHMAPILQALLVTFLWSTSFIIIKWGLDEIHPITYAGLRYSLAFLCFIPFLFKRKYSQEIKALTPQQWRKLILLGIVFYAFAQGTMFLGLSLLPAVTVSLLLNFSPLLVAGMGIKLLHERPNRIQWIGAIVFILGAVYYLFPVSLLESQGLGLAVMLIAIMANSSSSILGRDVNRDKKISPLVITSISMGIGAFLLLIIGVSMTGIPTMSNQNWLFLLWLAVINTAFAFTLWNHTLRSLSAMESSIINNTMLIQIAILGWFFLDEKISTQEGIGLSIAALGAVLVQLKNNSKK